MTVQCLIQDGLKCLTYRVSVNYCFQTENDQTLLKNLLIGIALPINDTLQTNIIQVLYLKHSSPIKSHILCIKLVT